MWKEYLSFSKSERITFLSLSVVILLLLCLSFGIKAIDFSPTIDTNEERLIRDFYNSINDSLVTQGKRWHSKGQEFAKSDTTYLNKRYSKPQRYNFTKSNVRNIEERMTVEINSADTAIFALLPGIGQSISSRIVKYRGILKGFYAKEQLLEVYGVDSLLFLSIANYLILDSVYIEPLNLNEISVSRMKNHPYLNFYQAKEIYERRLKNGNFKSMDEIVQLPSFKEVDVDRITRYFCVK